MRDRAARQRFALGATAPGETGLDPRVHVDLAHLRRLEGPARGLSFLPRQPARSILSGRHASRLRGRGLNFEELRQYLPGDDIRTIDWKVTARTREPHVRVYTEERDRPALIVVDQRMSMFFGSKLNMKSVTASEAAALAAFRIVEQRDRLGAIVFTDAGILEMRPRSSRSALNRFLSELAAANQALAADAEPVEATPINAVLKSVAQIARRDHLIVFLSDFDGIDDHTETLVGGLARRNDLVLGFVTDPFARHLPERLQLIISDGVLQAELKSADGEARRLLAEFSAARLARIAGWQTRLGVPVLPLDAAQETLPQLRRLMGVGPARRG